MRIIMEDDIVNLTLVQVDEMVESFCDKNLLACPCHVCLNDIKALALNNLPPRYISNQLDMNSESYLCEKEVEQEVKRAILTIKKYPHH